MDPLTLVVEQRPQKSTPSRLFSPSPNYGMPGSLKNAIDFLSHEWNYKPVAFVS